RSPALVVPWTVTVPVIAPVNCDTLPIPAVRSNRAVLCAASGWWSTLRTGSTGTNVSGALVAKYSGDVDDHVGRRVDLPGRAAGPVGQPRRPGAPAGGVGTVSARRTGVPGARRVPVRGRAGPGTRARCPAGAVRGADPSPGAAASPPVPARRPGPGARIRRARRAGRRRVRGAGTAADRRGRLAQRGQHAGRGAPAPG